MARESILPSDPPVPPRSRASETAPLRGTVVRFVNDAALVASLRAGSSEAAAALYDRLATLVDRTLFRMLGPDTEIEDLRHEVFLRALARIHDLEDPSALAGWVRGIAVLVSRQTIDKRVRRRRWLFWIPQEDMPDVAAPSSASPKLEERAALRAVYAILEKLPTEERLVLTLRRVDERELADIADELDLSLATVKRRLTRATARFDLLASAHPALASWTKGEKR